MNGRHLILNSALCVLAGLAVHGVRTSHADAPARDASSEYRAAQTAAFASAQRSAANRAPTIAGTAPKSVLQGARYTFQPMASDSDGDAVTFSIVNRPAWATFDATTGRLEGTPGLGDIGAFTGIVIAASDGRSSSKLAPLNIKVHGIEPGWARLTWDPPPRANDSPATKVQGFKVYWGTKPGRYASSATIMEPSATAYVVESLPPNTYHFVVKSINSRGDEKVYSRPRSLTIP